MVELEAAVTGRKRVPGRKGWRFRRKDLTDFVAGSLLTYRREDEGDGASGEAASGHWAPAEGGGPSAGIGARR